MKKVVLLVCFLGLALLANGQNQNAQNIKACLISWAGYLGGYFYNNPFNDTADNYFMRDQNINLQIQTLDVGHEASYQNNTDGCQIYDYTVDEWGSAIAKGEFPDARIFFCTDWSQGGDKIVARQQIQQASDLINQTIASSYHTLLLAYLDKNNIQPNQVTIVQYDELSDAENAFKSNSSIAAVTTWAPNDLPLLNSVNGSHVLISTKDANYSQTITDCLFARGSWIDNNVALLTNFTQGWMNAQQIVSQPNVYPDAATRINQIYQNIYQVNQSVATNDIQNVQYRNFADNKNYFNVTGSSNGNITFDSQLQYFLNLYNKYQIHGNTTLNITDTSVLKDNRPLCGSKLCFQ